MSTNPNIFKDRITIKHQAIAGALSGLLEYSILYPIDLIKTRMQSVKPNPKAAYNNLLNSFYAIPKDEGLRRFFRGIPMPLLARLPACALYNVTYEKMKVLLGGRKGEPHWLLAQCASGALSAIPFNVIMNPIDVVKQRMQIYGSPYRSSLQCMKAVAKSEGIRAFYRSFPTQISIDIPYMTLHFVIYEWCQDTTNPQGSFDHKTFAVCGAVAGGIGGFLTTPLDVCRTLLNTQEKSTLGLLEKDKVHGFMSTVKTVYKVHGLSGFLRGSEARVMYYTTGTAISWYTYEYFTRFLSTKF